jgi:DNA repair photolyase
VDSLRWPLADASDAQGRLFDEPIFEREPGRGEFRGLEFLHVRARSIINRVPGPPRFGFGYSINAYRGCSHACVYCFARPTHAYLDLGIDDDFERKIVVKVNAVERLRVELDARRWAGDLIAMGTNTDPYQRCEGKYRLTQGIVEALAERANPFSILTKSTLVLRDLDLLAEAARRTKVRVALSIGTLDEDVWRTTEPGAPHPVQRMKAVERLNAAGVPCGVFVAPILPGLSDRPEQIEAVVRAAERAGASSIGTTTLHLRPGVKEVFLDHLSEIHPELLPFYRRLYPAGRSYAPKAEQHRITEIVRRSRSGSRTQGASARRGADHRPPPTTPTQLPLL